MMQSSKGESRHCEQPAEELAPKRASRWLRRSALPGREWVMQSSKGESRHCEQPAEEWVLI